MGAVATKMLADLRRRRLQTTVLAVVLLLASSAATLSLSILVESAAPFDHAFASANGAHIVIDYDASVSDSQLALTSVAGGVTASAGPWPVAIAALPATFGVIDGQMMSGRGQPDAVIDSVTMNEGRWWQRPGEVVLDQDTAGMLGYLVGDSLAVYAPHTAGLKGKGTGLPDGGKGPVLIQPGEGQSQPRVAPATTLTVVGIAASVSTPDVAAWMSPTDILTLSPTAAPERQMLYRLEPSATAADLSAGLARITAGLPANAVAGSLTYLETKSSVDEIALLYVPVLLAFSVFALLAAAFTIANVVSGVVLTSYRDIGVMRVVGFTPAQVATILVGQILVPVIAGAIVGVVAGVVGSQPTLDSTARSFGLPAGFALSGPVIVTVLLASVGVAFLAAVGPAIHAGRLSTAGAISRGAGSSNRAGAGGGGGRLRRLGLRLPMGTAARLGVAAGVAHPVRAAMTLGALLVGVAAVTFALGLNLSLWRVMTQIDRNEASPVRVEAAGPAVNPNDVSAAIAELPETGRVVSIGEATITVGRLGSVPFVGYDGDAGWIGYDLIHGRWFAGAGEVVAPTRVLTQAGLRLGDTLQLVDAGQSVTVRLVGEIFDTADESSDHLVLRGSFADVTALDPTVHVSRWEVQPTPGVELGDYSTALEAATNRAVVARTLEDSSGDEQFLLFLSVITFMGMMLTAISLGGVFDTVLLETRQRTREMAVLKALGLTPAQVVIMVVASVVPVGVLAGLLGVPLGMAFQRAALSYMGQTVAGTGIPERTFDVFSPIAFVGLGLAGLAIAAAGAYLPAQRAARLPIAPVLQAE